MFTSRIRTMFKPFIVVGRRLPKGHSCFTTGRMPIWVLSWKSQAKKGDQKTTTAKTISSDPNENCYAPDPPQQPSDDFELPYNKKETTIDLMVEEIKTNFDIDDIETDFKFDDNQIIPIDIYIPKHNIAIMVVNTMADKYNYDHSRNRITLVDMMDRPVNWYYFAHSSDKKIPDFVNYVWINHGHSVGKE